MKRLLPAIFIFLPVFAAGADLCPRIVLEAPVQPELTAEERTFLCGYQEAAEWQKMPLPQLEFHLRSILMSRGYHRPVLNREENDVAGRLRVDPGPRTLVKSVEIENSPVETNFNRVRGIKNKPLTPAAVDEVEFWLRSFYRTRGYACPAAEVLGDAGSSQIRAQIDAGPLSVFPEPAAEAIPGIKPRTMMRYHPFRAGDPFNSELLTLAEQRTSESGIVFSNHFTIACNDDRKPELLQHFVAGPPRVVRFAVGANTEVGPIVRADWSTSRIGSRGSNFHASSRFNRLEQRVSTRASVFPSSDPSSRFHASPQFSFGRTDEQRQSFFSIEGSAAPRTWYDTSGFKITGSLGPGLRHFQRLKGVGLDKSLTTSLDLDLEVLSHSLELHRANPDSGTIMTFKNMNSASGVLSKQNAFHFDLSGTQLWNVGGAIPPRWVLLFRARGATTVTDRVSDSPLLVPSNYRSYLGGAKDLRGFGLNEIPRSDAGALTAVNWSLETRIDIPSVSRLYALSFWDFGLLGTRGMKLDQTIYNSPGLGLYWVSPIGVLKGTIARGVVWRENSATALRRHWQIYLAFGEGV